jgi:hypothetical protein
LEREKIWAIRKQKRALLKIGGNGKWWTENAGMGQTRQCYQGRGRGIKIAKREAAQGENKWTIKDSKIKQWRK